MKKYQVYISSAAEVDLSRVVMHIAHQLHSPKAACSILSAIENAITDLAYTPNSFSLVDDVQLAEAGYRKHVIGNHLIFFTVDEASKTVDIARILFTRHDWKKLL